MSRLEIAACLGLFVTGVYSTSFGPALPVLANDFGVSLDHAGLLITVLFLGSIIASGLVAIRLHAIEPKWTAAAGLAGVALGAAALGAAGSWWVALGSVACMGAGDGLMVAAVHSIVARESHDVAAGVNRLNVCFAVGAIAGPLWAATLLSADARLRGVVYAGVAAIALLAAAVVLSGGATRGPGHAGSSPPGTGAMDRAAWHMGAVLFLYVGAEFGLGSWVASYADREFGASILAGGIITAGYWASLMCGRLLSGALFAHAVPARTVLLASIACGTLASSAMAAANDFFALAVAGAFATGLAFGPIWPAAMAIAAERRSGNAPAAMVTIGNSGGFVFPWLQGQLLVSAGPATGIALSALLCAGMFAIARATPRQVEPRSKR